MISSIANVVLDLVFVIGFDYGARGAAIATAVSQAAMTVFIIFYAHSKYPDKAIVAIAVAAKCNGKVTERPTYPCGACRQVLQESQQRGGKKIKIIIGSATKVQVLDSVSQLLPFAFDNLPREKNRAGGRK